MTDHSDSRHEEPKKQVWLRRTRKLPWHQSVQQQRYGGTFITCNLRRMPRRPGAVKKIPKPNPYGKFPVNASVLDSYYVTGRSRRQHLSYIAYMDKPSGVSSLQPKDIGGVLPESPEELMKVQSTSHGGPST